MPGSAWRLCCAALAAACLLRTADAQGSSEISSGDDRDVLQATISGGSGWPDSWSGNVCNTGHADPNDGWLGVTCSARHNDGGRIQQIDINTMVDTVAPASVVGDIQGWSALTGLTLLDLSGTAVEGDIESFSALTQLVTLRLGLSPRHDASRRALTGNVAGFRELVSLAVLELQDNHAIEGDITEWASGLTSLTFLDLKDAGDTLSGDISGFRARTSLTHLDLQRRRSGSGLTGDVAEFSALTRLAVLNLKNNRAITGAITGWASALTSLTYLDLNNAGDDLSGDISGFRARTSLTHLDLQRRRSGSGLTGDVAEFSALTSLTHLDLVNNRAITGSIEGWNVLTSLTFLNLKNAGDDMDGDISGFSALVSLSYLQLRRRSSGVASGFTGSITGLGALGSLRFVSLENNQRLEGDVSRWPSDAGVPNFVWFEPSNLVSGSTQAADIFATVCPEGSTGVVGGAVSESGWKSGCSPAAGWSGTVISTTADPFYHSTLEQVESCSECHEHECPSACAGGACSDQPDVCACAGCGEDVQCN
eukprot:SAG22_NODE_2837_length_2166_cov_7.731979_1_plen_536_part_10